MKLLFTSLLFLFSFSLIAQTPAFPGAEGGGMYTTGGRGGTVYFVTSLDDTNTGNDATREGTLRWAVSKKGARIIVFKVSGIITLRSVLSINNGDLTIAGQTAPGDGICIRDYEVKVNADNVIIRYMRFRLGDRVTTHEPDAIWGRYKKNIILDHCSVSWSIDECASFYSNENFTMQWCYITESMNQSLHGKGNHGYGGLWGGKNATFHHNLLAHHNSRNPRFNGWKRSGLSYNNPMDEERMDYRNNVIYNWGSQSAYGGESAGKYNIVANYYKSGPASSNKNRIVQVDIDKDIVNYPPGYGSFYIKDNYVYGYTNVTLDNWLGVTLKPGVNRNVCEATEPFECYPITQHTAVNAYEKVLTYGGASLVRDAVDTRIAQEARDGSYTYTGSKTGKTGIIDSQEDVGGWPEYNSLAAPDDSDRDGIPDGWLDTNYPGKTANELNEEGYTYLELYLNSLVAHITEEQNKDALTSINVIPGKEESSVHIWFDRTVNSIQLESYSGGMGRICVYGINGNLLSTIHAKGDNVFSTGMLGLNKGVYIVKVQMEDGSTEVGKIMVY